MLTLKTCIFVTVLHNGGELGMHNNIIRNASSLYTVHHFTSVIFAACNRNRLINVSFQIYLRNTLNMPRSDLCAPTPGSVHRFRVKQPIVMVLIPLNACGDFSYKTRCPQAVEHGLNSILCFNTCTSFATYFLACEVVNYDLKMQ